MKKIITLCICLFIAISSKAVHTCSTTPGVTISVDTNCYVIDVIYPACYPNLQFNERILALNTPYERTFSEVDFGYLDPSASPFVNTQWTGGPAIPFLSLNLQIPESAIFEAFIEYIDYDDDIYLNHDYVPTQNYLESDDLDTVQYNSNYYEGDSAVAYLSSPVQISAPYTYMGTTGINVQLKPFTYDSHHKIISPIREIRYIICVSGNESLLDMYNGIIEQEDMGVAINYYNTYCNDILRNPDGGKGNFLIITSPEYEYEAETYAQHKNNLGYNAWVETYDPLYTSAVDIRHFLKAYYDYAETRPRYVLIIGDHEVIPYSAGVPDVDTNPLTDIYYACLDHYNIEDETELVPDVFVGRWPISNHNQLQYVMEKSIYYDLIVPENRRVALFTGIENTQDVLYSNIYVHNLIWSEIGHVDCVIYYGGWGDNTSTMVSEFSNYRDLMMVYRGHGNVTGFDVPFDGILSVLLPNDLPYFTLSLSCLTGSPNGLGVHWITDGDRSVTFLGATVVTYRDSNTQLEKEIFDGLRDFENYTIGEFIYKGVGKYFMNSKDSLEVRSYVLYGDPSLYIYGMELLGNPVQYMPRYSDNDNAIDTTLSDDEIYAYNVYNPLGIVIKSDNGTKRDIYETLQELESGIYVISVLDQNNQLVFSNKVYVEKNK